MVNVYKILFIVLLVIFIIENIFWGFAIYMAIDDEKKTQECYYDICEDYPQAFYEDGLCSCYDWDLMGELQVVETEIMR